MSDATTTVSQKTTTRTCVACGRGDAKNKLIRFVRTKDGEVFCDASGRAAGRGAYLCAAEEGFAAAKKRGRLSRALKCQIGDEMSQRLEEAFKDVCDQDERKA